METKDKILKFAKTKPFFTTKEILSHLKNTYTRQHMVRLLSKLVENGTLTKTGSTRNAKYKYETNMLSLHYPNKNLEEHKVFQEIEAKLPFIRQIPEHIHSIFVYAFSEMLNNAIEHSASSKIDIDVGKYQNRLVFKVRDYGIGVFKSIISKTKVKTELEAIQELLKGKLTTAPKAHSGEGIFFTSKSGESFILNSFDHQLKIDNELDDIFITPLQPDVQGTQVIFEIDLNHKDHLNDIFTKFTSDSETPHFDTTEVRIKLYTMGTIYISRSQARRVLQRLENFKKIILDFDKVPTIGQAFADEVFRVFTTTHPGIEIIPENMNKTVEFMVKRVEKS